MIEKLGVQLYTVREHMNTPEEVRQTFKRLKSMGYDQVQTAGTKIPYEDFGRIAQEEGLEIVGTHDSWDRLLHDFDEALRIHDLMHTNLMGIGGIGMLNVKETEEFIKNANSIGQKAAQYGKKFTFHHHSHEFIRRENGKTMMDMLVEGFDKKNVSFVVDTYWIQNGGGDVRHWIEQLAGRIDILHLKDMKKDPAESDWQKTVYCEIGCGNMWWEGILESAEKAGVKYYVVEQDQTPGGAFESLAISSDFIHKHFMA